MNSYHKCLREWLVTANAVGITTLTVIKLVQGVVAFLS